MTALDVGAGLGKCMTSLAHAGFDAYGLEPSVPFYERALSEMKISPERLKLGMIEDIEYEGSAACFNSNEQIQNEKNEDTLVHFDNPFSFDRFAIVERTKQTRF